MSRHWKRWTGAGLLLLIVAAVLAIFAVFESGFANQWTRAAVVRQIQEKTGTRVELGGFHFNFWRLHAEMKDLTLHGQEGAAEPALFHADSVEAGARIISFWGRRIALDTLIVEHPEVAIRVYKDGRSNLPHPTAQVHGSPWQETLLDLRIGQIELRDGTVIFNDRREPLALEGRDLDFSLHYNASSAGADSYIGNLRWRQIHLSARRDAPFQFGLSAKFTLHRDAFELDELVCTLPHSELNLRAELASFAHQDWNLWYRGRLSLADVRMILRAPLTPDGLADFSGQAHYTSGEWTANGHYLAHDIRMRYQWFHAGNFETWGDYDVARRRLVVPNLNVRALGGTVEGKLEMDFDGLAFRTETRLRGISLAETLAALNHPGFPVRAMHWDGSVDVDAVNTWNANFQHFRTKGVTRWSSPVTLAPGMIPATARADYDYSMDGRLMKIQQGEISTPNTDIEFAGTLGAADSALDTKLRTSDLLDWDGFIAAIRGPDAGAERIAGKALWDGRILGPIAGPTFAGHIHATEARYADLYWDTMDGGMEYSPDGLRLTKMLVQHGHTSATLNLSLQFDGDWSFLPASTWTLDARAQRASTDDLQSLFGTSYPVSGLLSGDFHGSGTRTSPALDANFVLDAIHGRRFRFDRLSGQLHWERDEVRLSSAELRSGSGRVVGDLRYRPDEQLAEFNLTGANLALDRYAALQSASLPIAGQLDFDLKGSGPLRAPIAQGSFRLMNFVAGPEAEGNFRGQVTSDGHNARISVSSELARGKLQGQLTVGLAGNLPVFGTLSVNQFDLDPLISAGLHLRHLTSHSSVDGLFTIAGALRQPDMIEVDADIQRISFDYEFVRLTNDKDIRLTYHRNEVRIEQAHLHGSDTDLQLSGSARFDGERPLHFALSGSADLRLLQGILPALDAQGHAQMNVSIEGTMAQPQITGQASIRDASAHYADFPVGLSGLNGELVFDRSRLLFDHVTAEAGGGELTLSGSVSYGEGPVRYEINATTPLVRIRYPAGMSWLVGGALQLSGTSTAALLSGQVRLQRLLFAQGVDVASFFAAASETVPGPASSSAFLRNLSFDVGAQTTPGAQIEWTGAHVEMDGDVRLRGTWDRPVLLGHVHLLGGEMPFRGNVFELTRGDINFANPFRLDPVMNVEATSTISQYQVTINFSGAASHLALNYRSDPPLPDSDIIGLLALGSTGQEAGLRSQSAASPNYGATALLSEAISTGIGGRIEHLFGISQFRVDPFVAGPATESNAAARVTIQEQVTHDLTITYSSNAATSNQYQMIEVQYNVKRDLSIVFLRDINGTNGLDIKWVKHFK